MSEVSQWQRGRPRGELWFVIKLSNLQAVDAMEHRWKMSVVVSVQRLQQSVQAVLGVLFLMEKALIDGADFQETMQLLR